MLAADQCTLHCIPGWCYIEGHNHNHTSTREDREQLGWILFSYEFWVSGSMLFMLVMVLMFCIIFCAKKIKVNLKLAVLINIANGDTPL